MKFEVHTISDAPTLSRHGVVAGKRYRLLHERLGKSSGSVCYLCERSDYGTADDDERAYGVQCVAMTLEPTGDYPFITVPVVLLEEVV